MLNSFRFTSCLLSQKEPHEEIETSGNLKHRFHYFSLESLSLHCQPYGALYHYVSFNDKTSLTPPYFRVRPLCVWSTKELNGVSSLGSWNNVIVQTRAGMAEQASLDIKWGLKSTQLLWQSIRRLGLAHLNRNKTGWTTTTEGDFLSFSKPGSEVESDNHHCVFVRTLEGEGFFNLTGKFQTLVEYNMYVCAVVTRLQAVLKKEWIIHEIHKVVCFLVNLILLIRLYYSSLHTLFSFLRQAFIF